MKIRSVLAFTTAVLLSAGNAAAQNWDEPEEETEEGPEETTAGPRRADDAAKAGEPEEPPAELKPVSLGLLLGYGVYLGAADKPNPFGFGVGLKGGYSLDMGLYLGGKAIYFLGESAEEIPGFESSAPVLTAGAEGGYNVEAGPVIVQPSVEVGVAVQFITAEVPGIIGVSVEEVSDTKFRLYVAPGASVIYPTGNLFVGADVRVPLVFADDIEAGLTLMANVGLAF